jgi:hypothetical protein
VGIEHTVVQIPAAAVQDVHRFHVPARPDITVTPLISAICTACLPLAHIMVLFR